MRLIERRIGLLFAVFLFLLCAGAARAARLSVIKRGTLERAANTQQQADVVVPARRGAITDDHGIELAVSEPAVDVAATPYLIKDAPRTAARLAPLLQQPEDRLLRQLARRDTGFAYLARRVPADRALRVQKLAIEGLPRGETLEGKRVVIVEDVTTTGGSAMKAVEAVRETGAEVVLVLTMVDREEGADDTFGAAGLPFRSLYKASEFLKA